MINSAFLRRWMGVGDVFVPCVKTALNCTALSCMQVRTAPGISLSVTMWTSRCCLNALRFMTHVMVLNNAVMALMRFPVHINKVCSVTCLLLPQPQLPVLFVCFYFIFKSSPGDDLINWNSGVSERPSTKFSNFDLIWCVDRPRPDMHTSMTSTRSKVKVTEPVKLRKLHFSGSISSAIFTWSSKLMVDGDSMGPGLQLVGARFWNFLLGKLSQEFSLRGVSIFHQIQMAIFR